VTVAGSDPASSAEKAGVPLSASNLALRVLSAAILAPLALLVAYVGGWPFALFWGIAAIIVLWEWLTLVVGPSYRFMLSSCAAAIAVADLLACFGKPVTALWMIGLGALAAAIFAPREWRLWVLGGTGYAGGMMTAMVLSRSCSCLLLFGRRTSSAILADAFSAVQNFGLP
jgi:phosphatidate cytidylyltransferase